LNAVKHTIIKPRTDSQDIIYKRGVLPKAEKQKMQNSRKEKKQTVYMTFIITIGMKRVWVN